MKKKLVLMAAGLGAVAALSVFVLNQPLQAQQREIICDQDAVEKGDCEAVDTDDVRVLKLDINSLIDEKESALHTQQEYNQGGVNRMIRDFDEMIARYTQRRDEAQNMRAAQHWQDKINDLEAQKAYHTSEEPGYPRDEASKLGPVISQLQQDINDLKQELRAIEQ